jgi:hypothetical protein
MRIKNNKRRTIEIYFILYLAALMFLLPDGTYEQKKGQGTGIQIYQPEFVVIPEKTTLTCRVVLDSAGPRIISLDSINTIFYTGDVENVEFEFKVEDQFLRNTLTLSNDKHAMTKYFRFDEQPDKHAAFFKWTPPLQENFSRTYTVKVIATAKLRNPDGESITENRLVKHTAQFNLLVIYLNAPGGNPIFAQNYFRPMMQDTAFQFTLPYQSFIPQIPSGEVMGWSENAEVRQIANQRWFNTVFFTNINLNSDLFKYTLTPDRKLDNGGSVEIAEIRQNAVILQGITPSYGKLSVKIEVYRKPDFKAGSATFIVAPQPFEQPEFDKNMYPEVVYTIDPKLPDIGKDVKAVISDGRNIRAQSKGEVFKWSPMHADVGKEFKLIRYLGDEELEKNPINILAFPQPVIIDIKIISDKEVIVVTKSFGILNNTRNEVDEFIVEGNAKYRDLRGEISEQKDKIYPIVLQYFRFTPQNPDKPFSFKIEAVDRLKNKSLPKIYR